jgi:hypothetical protein
MPASNIHPAQEQNQTIKMRATKMCYHRLASIYHAMESRPKIFLRIGETRCLPERKEKSWKSAPEPARISPIIPSGPTSPE